MTGSNGMCAGNTTEEAIIQGICEIFERFAIRKIFLEDEKPPEIPIHYFKDSEIYNRIQKLKENSNIDITIYDCSMGLGIPVIGILLIYNDLKKYRFEFAGATNPLIALERCLTEHFQAFNPIDLLTDIHNKRNYFDRSEADLKLFYYYQQTSEGNGDIDLPNWILKEESYPFNGLKNIAGNTHKEELLNLLDLIKHLGFDIYLRDNSILGFPTYHIIIPTMSEISFLYKNDDLFNALLIDDNIEAILNLKVQSNEKLNEIAIILDRMHDNKSIININKDVFLYNISKKIKEIDQSLFIASMFLKLGDLKKALKYIKLYIAYNKKDEKIDIYHTTIVQHRI